MGQAETDAEVLTWAEGRVGRIRLNRPRALHALTTGMCRAMIKALTDWRADPDVALVLLDHSGDRGFCAGGDVRRVAQSAAGDGAEARGFFHAEYQLNALMFDYPKPIVAVMDGVTMGGGIGISRPARYRVATERTIFAWPEAALGLFPDVGGGWYLPRMPDHIGPWLALTGERLGAADGELVGLATDYVESARIPQLKAAIVADPEGVERLLTEFEGDAGRPALAAHQDEIRRTFGLGSVEAILEALAAAGTPWGRAQIANLRGKCPMTLKVALRQLRLGAVAKGFAENMEMEYRIAARMALRPDFRDGVRALLIDKDNAPRWDPPSLSAVTEAMVEEIFALLPSSEAWTPLP